MMNIYTAGMREVALFKVVPLHLEEQVKPPDESNC
jgi:hypothetical protein